MSALEAYKHPIVNRLIAILLKHGFSLQKKHRVSQWYVLFPGEDFKGLKNARWILTYDPEKCWQLTRPPVEFHKHATAAIASYLLTEATDEIEK